MKISKLFHWLYASVMFLPLLIIPIFAIWTINHDNNQSISIDVSRNKVVDFNQLVKNGNFVDTDYWFSSLANYDTNDNVLTIQATDYDGYVMQSGINFIAGNVYYLKVDVQLSNVASNVLVQAKDGGYAWRTATLTNTLIKTTLTYRWTPDISNSNGVVRFVDDTSNSSVYYDFYVSNAMLFNLTQMFGVGNEPTIEEFNVWYNQHYYDFTISQSQLLKDYEIVTYDNTDVGSQFIYTLYRSCDEYLNFDDVLSLGSISDWIEENVFNGNAPLVYTIVWHYLDYWLILSIFWLCFDVLIYVPQIAHRWLDKASLE